MKLYTQLLQTYRGKYVAIHEGQLVESGDDKIAVALRAYEQYGYIPIIVTLVTDEPPPVVRIRKVRIVPREIQR